MKKLFLLIFILLVVLASGQDIFDFVPSDFGYFLVINKTLDYLDYLKSNSPFFNVYFSKEGFDAENIIFSYIDAAGYNYEVDTSILKKSLNNEILIAGDNLDLNIQDFLVFDPIYYIELFKSSSGKVFLIWETENSSSLIEAISAVLNLSIFKQKGEDIHELRGNGVCFYYKTYENYLLIGSTKESLNTADEVYSSRDNNLLSDEDKKKYISEKMEDTWLTGYFDSNKFSIDLGIKASFSTKETYLFALPKDDALVVEINQKMIFLNKDELIDYYTNYKNQKKELEKMIFGDYVVFFPSESIGTLTNELSNWFEINLEQYSYLANLFIKSIESSENYARIFGDIFGDKADFSVIFNLDDAHREDFINYISDNLKKYSEGIYFYQVGNSSVNLYVFLNENELVITTLLPENFKDKIKKGFKLSEYQTFSELKKKSMDDVIIEGYLDLSVIFEEYLGISVKSALLFQQNIDQDGNAKYYIMVK
jgi:hypothetical protein